MAMGQLTGEERDEVDDLVAAWREQRPDLDVAPLQVLSRVSRLARHLDIARRGAFAAHGLESWEFDVLSALRRAGPPFQLTPGALLRATLVTSGTMTNRIDRLAAAGLVVSNVTWTMTVGSATMNGFVYKGNVDLPLAGGGTIQMMEFTVSSMSMSNITTLISENGVTGKETDAAFTASGVTLYATQLTGDIYGIPLPVTFTPTTVLTQLLKVTNLATGTVLPISMTNLTADRAVILAGQAQKTAVAVSD